MLVWKRPLTKHVYQNKELFKCPTINTPQPPVFVSVHCVQRVRRACVAFMPSFLEQAFSLMCCGALFTNECVAIVPAWIHGAENARVAAALFCY